MNLKKLLSIYFMLFLCISVFAQGTGKAITVSFSDISLQQAMNKVKEVSGYTFFYDANQIDTKQKVSLSANRTPIGKAMEQMLKGTDISFEITNTQIALFKKTAGKKAAAGKEVTVKGKIVDEAGEPIIGASVMVEGTSNGVITDIDGNYTLKAPSEANLKISYIGYVSQTVKAGVQPVLTLREDSKQLEEVIVVGYGTMKKQDLTGAVNSLRGSDLEKEQPQTVQDMLRTGVAGMYVAMPTDTKGNTSMMIRGKGTIGASTSPLIVLDGVIYPGEMTDINPNDIERIDVLKDASSTAVYGAQAANGVVLVTTKKGTTSKKPTISFNGKWGFSMLNSLPEIYQGDDYVNFRRDVEKSHNADKAATGYFDNPANLTGSALEQWMDGATGDPQEVWMRRLEFTDTEVANYMAGRTVDWKDWIYQDMALRQEYTVSIAGKKEEMSYYSSLNYVKNESNTIGGGFSAIRARVNLENKVQNFLTYGMNAQFTARDEGYISRNNSYTSLSPFGSVFEEDGTTPKYYPNDNNNAVNPLVTTYYQDKMKNIYNLNSSIYLKVDLPLGFSLQTTYTPRFEWTNDFSYRSADDPSAKDGGSVSRNNSTLFYWQWDNMLKWNKDFGKHSFDFTGLLNWEKHQKWSSSDDNIGFQPSDILGFHGIGYGTSPTVGATDTYWTGAAMMARMHYSYDQRYLVTATVRRDGYSAFGQNNPYATFPSVALGWVFSEEKFVHMPKWFDYGKLRLSWGKNGNRSVGQYDALMKLEPRKYFYYDQNSGELVNINTFYCYNMANAGLRWEATDAWNVGMDFSMLGGRLSGSVDGYVKRTVDLLNNRKLPSLIGYTSVKANIGEVRNSGIEISLSSTNIKNDYLTWNTTFNFAWNKNIIKHLYGLMEDVKDENGKVIGQKEADDISNGYFIGQALDQAWGYKYLGNWQENEAEEAKKYGQKPGDPKLLDVDHNYSYTNDDKVFLGHTTPPFRWNMRNSFTIFKNWNVAISMYSALGHVKSMGRFTNNNALLNVTNQIVRDYWTPENPINDYPRLKATSPKGVSYSIYKRNNFLRFDNISIGYTFPKKMIEPWKIQAMNVNLSIKNVGYISPWPAYDPENSDANTPRTIYLGVNLTL